MTTSDIEIGIIVESLSDHFLISPNALHRGMGEYACLTLHERAMLSALLTLRGGENQWITSRADIDKIAPELGRDKMSRIIRGLKDKRYLYTRRVHAGNGRFRWEWRVYMRQCAEGFDPFDGTTPAISGQAATTPPDATAGTSAESTPNSATATGPPDATANTPTDEDRAVDDAIALCPTWRSGSVRAALRQAIADGLPSGVAYRTIVDLARGDVYGPTTAGPQRIIARGPWWTPGAVFIPAPARGSAAICEIHPGQLAASCACCAGERRGSDSGRQAIGRRTSAPAGARKAFARIPALSRVPGSSAHGSR